FLLARLDLSRALPPHPVDVDEVSVWGELGCQGRFVLVVESIDALQADSPDSVLVFGTIAGLCYLAAGLGAAEYAANSHRQNCRHDPLGHPCHLPGPLACRVIPECSLTRRCPTVPGPDPVGTVSLRAPVCAWAREPIKKEEGRDGPSSQSRRRP